MKYRNTYNSPLGLIYLESDGKYLTGLWFDLSNDFFKSQDNFISKDLPIFNTTKKWLDLYFSGKIPDFTPKYKLENFTPFRKMVTDIMLKIPYGKIITYNDIATKIARINGIKKMSAQAVGRAIGSNPIHIIIPCHRVIGQNLNLIGYRGGITNKKKLLEIEKHDLSKFTIPKRVTAL